MAVIKTVKDIVIANHHTADIILSRVYHPNIEGDPTKRHLQSEAIIIHRGTARKVKAEEWELRKDSRVIQYYLDNKIISVTHCEGPSEIAFSGIMALEVPDHLKPNDEGEVFAPSAVDPNIMVAAKLKKGRTSSMTITGIAE